MKRFLVIPFVFLALNSPVRSEAPAMADDASTDWPSPERSVSGNVLTSTTDPAIRVVVPDDAEYIGSVRWPLYNVTDAEMHVFIEADDYGLVERFYWIQFESYLDDNHHTFDYPQSNPQTMELDGRTVHVLPGMTMANPPEIREGSDGSMFRQLVAEAGYRLPTYMANVRFVELFEPSHRKELMIIYGENLDAVITQLGAAQARGRESFAFAEMYPPLIERAASNLDLMTPD